MEKVLLPTTVVMGRAGSLFKHGKFINVELLKLVVAKLACSDVSESMSCSGDLTVDEYEHFIDAPLIADAGLTVEPNCGLRDRSRITASSQYFD